ncbi:hypothetical protein JXM83_00115 [Candidatus Woesearchaeota archaeon]|nr:hypothetical protein [Candidatus Woesearchaeota archaeon]
MHLETYNNKKESHKKKRSKINLIIFIAFLFAIGTIITNVYPNGINFTGMSILPEKTPNITSTINASLSIPGLTFKNTFEEIRITVAKESSINIGGKTFSLKETEREIILKDFEGTIIFDEEKIYTLKGKASEIILSGIPITPEKNKIDVSLNQNTIYKKILITEELYIKSLEYIASGEIKINEDTIKLNSEKLILNNYQGNIKAENKKLYLTGKINSIEVLGETRKIKISQ